VLQLHRNKLLLLALITLLLTTFTFLIFLTAKMSSGLSLSGAQLAAADINVSGSVPVSTEFAQSISQNSSISIDALTFHPGDHAQVIVSLIGPSHMQLTDQVVRLRLYHGDNKLDPYYEQTSDSGGIARFDLTIPRTLGSLTLRVGDRSYKYAGLFGSTILLNQTIIINVLNPKTTKASPASPAKAPPTPAPSPTPTSSPITSSPHPQPPASPTPSPSPAATPPSSVTPQTPASLAPSPATGPATPAPTVTGNISNFIQNVQTTVTDFFQNIFHLF